MIVGRSGGIGERQGRGSGSELAFSDSDDSLPWLEGDEEDEDQAIDTGRVIAFAIGALVVLALTAGVLWWVFHGATMHLVADGSTIEAPDGPYKTRPDDPGGRVHAGTGDLRFMVAEGRSMEGRVANSGIVRPSAEAGGEGGAGSAAATGIGVQIAAYTSRQAAQRGWWELSGRFVELKGMDHRIIEGRADIDTVFRLQAVAPDLAAANQLCDTIRSAGGACQVKR